MNHKGCDPRSEGHGRSVMRLACVVMAMFGFGYALVPLYDVFCELTGINGKTGVVAAEAVGAGQIDTSRWVTVEFTGNTTQGLPWEFRPNENKIRVHPGELVETTFYARNTSARRLAGQAVPSVTPSTAAAHFKKTECFCFTRQVLDPGQGLDMAVRFLVQTDLPEDVHTITLSYAFFRAHEENGARNDLELRATDGA